MEIVAYGGWERVARIVSGEVELLVTLEVGPRVIRLGFVGGPNELVEIEEDMGLTGGDEFRLYGGHRLWIAPEVVDRTLQPDNDAVEYTVEGDTHHFLAPADKWHVQKKISITPDGKGGFSLVHQLFNHTPYTIDLAPWTLTQFAPGGTAYFPMPEFKAHTEKVLPDRPLVLWAYTNLADPRWSWGRSMSSFRHDPTMGPQKVGSFVKQGYAAYANNGNLFIKTFDAHTDDGFSYPDFGCNFETFANELFLEVESLGPMENLAPHSSLAHKEGWRLNRNVAVPTDLEEAANLIATHAKETPGWTDWASFE